MQDTQGTVIVTGASGFIGSAVVKHLAKEHRVVALDLHPSHQGIPNIQAVETDLSSDDSVSDALDLVRMAQGQRIASVVHLAAYFDMSGEPDPRYDEITVRGTERLLRELKSRFTVEQFLFSSTMLVHKAGKPGERIDESRELDPSLPYPASKIKTEQLLSFMRGPIPVVFMRLAGVYDEYCHNTFLAHQIARIYERSIKGHLYAGPLETGQSFVHRNDVARAVECAIARRAALPGEFPVLIGEPEVMSYGELQKKIGCLLYGEAWQTWEVSETLAKIGTWLEEELFCQHPFVRTWMIEHADDHYELNIERARTKLGWEPQYRLRNVLSAMVDHLKAAPVAWYKMNKLDAERIADKQPADPSHQSAG
jgi:nucleoside-diphosphate-sugar epimerase